MELGMIGLGKMGGFMTERLIRGGHRVIGFDRDPAVVQKLAEKGAGSANSLDNIISQLKPPRAIWLMVPWIKRLLRSCHIFPPATRLLTAAIRTTKIPCAGRPHSRQRR